MVVVVCTRCRYFWNYQGQMRIYATCPSCLKKVRMKKKKVEKKNLLKRKAIIHA